MEKQWTKFLKGLNVYQTYSNVCNIVGNFFTAISFGILEGIFDVAAWVSVHRHAIANTTPECKVMALSTMVFECMRVIYLLNYLFIMKRLGILHNYNDTIMIICTPLHHV